jgi:hypothetical protein
MVFILFITTVFLLAMAETPAGPVASHTFYVGPGKL